MPIGDRCLKFRDYLDAYLAGTVIGVTPITIKQIQSILPEKFDRVKLTSRLEKLTVEGIVTKMKSIQDGNDCNRYEIRDNRYALAARQILDWTFANGICLEDVVSKSNYPETKLFRLTVLDALQYSKGLTAKEIIALSDMPFQRVHENLNELTRNGLIIPPEAREPTRYAFKTSPMQYFLSHLPQMERQIIKRHAEIINDGNRFSADDFGKRQIDGNKLRIYQLIEGFKRLVETGILEKNEGHYSFTTPYSEMGAGAAIANAMIERKGRIDMPYLGALHRAFVEQKLGEFITINDIPADVGNRDSAQQFLYIEVKKNRLRCIDDNHKERYLYRPTPLASSFFSMRKNIDRILDTDEMDHTQNEMAKAPLYYMIRNGNQTRSLVKLTDLGNELFRYISRKGVQEIDELELCEDIAGDGLSRRFSNYPIVNGLLDSLIEQKLIKDIGSRQGSSIYGLTPKSSALIKIFQSIDACKGQ